MDWNTAIISIVTGVSVGVILLIANLIKDGIKKRRSDQMSDSAQVKDNTKRIAALEDNCHEQEAFDKAILGMVIIIGDGMIQSGVNGDVKTAFNQAKQDALKLL